MMYDAKSVRLGNKIVYHFALLSVFQPAIGPRIILALVKYNSSEYYFESIL